MSSKLSLWQHPLTVSLAILFLSIILVGWTSPDTLSLIPFQIFPLAPTARIDLLDVSYRGVASNGVEHFFNIFYAKDTSGPNRFTPPVRYTPPKGAVIDASAPGASCAQGVGDAAFPFTSPVTNISENCLSLRISRAKGIKAGDKLPVLVWIHGGGNALGTAYDQLYKPDGLVRQANNNGQPVIFVALNYRLGIFGFAANKALRNTKQGNAGLRDQREAFNWIKDNIAYFGGDPDNVTAMGQSVGASAIGLHLTSYNGKRGVPFQKAIMMSGASGLNFNIKSSLVANNTRTVAQKLDCVRGDADSEATIECLREVPMDKLMNVSVTLSRQLRPPFGELSFYPSFDGDYIADRPSQLLRSGQFVKDIPILASWTANDGAWYAAPDASTNDDVLASFSRFITDLSPASLQRFLALYPPSDFEHMVPAGSGLSPQYYRAAQINRDMWFTCPVIDFTWHYARQHGGRGPSLPPAEVRLYEMNQTRFGPVFDALGIGFWRVSHLSDIPYILNGDVAGGGDNGPQQRRLARRLAGSAAAFAYSGDPSRAGSGGAEVLRGWPPAYRRGSSSSAGEMRGEEEVPDHLRVYVVGGPHGGGSAEVSRGVAGKGEPEPRAKAVEWERLLERCEFINSINEEIGV